MVPTIHEDNIIDNRVQDMVTFSSFIIEIVALGCALMIMFNNNVNIILIISAVFLLMFCILKKNKVVLVKKILTNL